MIKETQKPFIVEVGPYGSPIYGRSVEVADKIRAGALYLGVDRYNSGVWHIKHGFGVVAELSDLPIPDSSADEVWLMNVTNCPGNWHKHSPIELPDGRLWNDKVYKCFQELSRVTKPGGQINIGEFDAGIHDNLKMFRGINFEELDLSSEFFIEEETNRFLKLHKATDKLKSIVNEAHEVYPPAFFLTLTKRK